MDNTPCGMKFKFWAALRYLAAQQVLFSQIFKHRGVKHGNTLYHFIILTNFKGKFIFTGILRPFSCGPLRFFDSFFPVYTERDFSRRRQQIIFVRKMWCFENFEEKHFHRLQKSKQNWGKSDSLRKVFGRKNRFLHWLKRMTEKKKKKWCYWEETLEYILLLDTFHLFMDSREWRGVNVLQRKL